MACRDCCAIHIDGVQARTGLGEGRQIEGNTLFGKNRGWKGGKIVRSEEDERRRGRTRRRRRIRRPAQKLRTEARAGFRAGELVMGTFNVRTLAFKNTNGIGHAEVTLKTCEDAGCDVI